MMSYLFFLMIALSVLFGALTGRIEAVSLAAMSECGRAVELVISLMGVMCLWSGLMQVAESSHLTEKLSHAFSPLIRRLFRGLDPDSAAGKAICMNLTANLLGLGNAATPLGITAMKELDELNHRSPTASSHMILFVVLNTASLQLIPTTTATLRLQAGSTEPFAILPAVWVASIASVLAGVIAAILPDRSRRRRHG